MGSSVLISAQVLFCKMSEHAEVLPADAADEDVDGYQDSLSWSAEIERIVNDCRIHTASWSNDECTSQNGEVFDLKTLKCCMKKKEEYVSKCLLTDFHATTRINPDVHLHKS